jgi:hypothetical protein
MATKLEELMAEAEAADTAVSDAIDACDAAEVECHDTWSECAAVRTARAGAWAVARARAAACDTAAVAAREAYEAELKKVQQENSND